MAVFDFDEESRRMRLRALAPWATVDDVAAETDFDLLIASPLETMELPTEEALAALRADVDPTGRTIRGRWITVEEEDGRVVSVQREAATEEP
jgi:glutaconate CoA-transferase subunit B